MAQPEVFLAGFQALGGKVLEGRVVDRGVTLLLLLVNRELHTFLVKRLEKGIASQTVLAP